MSNIMFDELSEIIGVSGYENIVRNKIENLLISSPDLRLETDKIGNLICYTNKNNSTTKKIMFLSHLDEVGFQVMKVDQAGNAYVKSLGNVRTWNMLNQHVKTTEGDKLGLFYCDNPENLQPYEYEKIIVIPIKGTFEIGDVLGFDTKLIETESQWIGKAIDNRISCYLLCQVLLSEVELPEDFVFVFSVQEESGMRGSRVAVAELSPDIIVDLDVSPVGERNSLIMGNGVGVKISDSISISSEALVKKVEGYALENGINIQREVSDCGTSELIITNERELGAERIGISIPCQHIHSSKTIVNKNDIDECRKLIELILKNGL